MKLFPKLALVTLFVALLPLSIVGFSLIRLERDAISGLLEARHIALANLCAERLSRALEETWTRLSATLRLVDAGALSREEALGLMRALYGQSDDVVSVQWVDGAGAHRHPRVALEGAADGRVAVTKEDSAALDAFLPSLAKLEVPEGELVMSEPLVFLGRATPSVLLVFAATAKSQERVIVEVSLRGAERAFSAAPRSDGRASGFALLARDGRVLVRSKGDAALAQLPARVDLGRVPVQTSFRVLLGEGRALAAMAPVGDTGLTVLVFDAEASVFAVAQQMQARTLQGLAAAAALSVLVGFFLSRSLRRRLAHYDAAAKSLGAGKLATRVSIDTADELSVLGTTLNSMAADLEASRAEIEAWNKELQARVEARTAELKAAQARLIQAARLTAVGQLGAGVAHEIGNPLARIIGYAQLVKADARLDKDTVDSLDKIEIAAKRVDDITKGLLRFSQTQALPAEPNVSLSVVAKEAAELVRTRVEAEGVRLTIDVDPALTLTCQPSQLVQALFQLLDNARKATKKDGSIAIEAKKPNGRVILGVRDTGVGIAKEDQDKLFDPFFTTKQDWQSPGLGLSLVYRIAEAHGADTLVESEPGHGAFVAIVFPP
ncbi:MAG: HAMP domain-containing protein [Deltaproteobacteria bacterium]|nr:HAMP domain-containing protein [Deltaproteobacteria bacterium]